MNRKLLTKLAVGTGVGVGSLIGMANLAGATEVHTKWAELGCIGEYVKGLEVELTNPWDVPIVVTIVNPASPFTKMLEPHQEWKFKQTTRTSYGDGKLTLIVTSDHGVSGDPSHTMTWFKDECGPTPTTTVPPTTEAPTTSSVAITNPVTTPVPPTTVDVCGDFGDKEQCAELVRIKFGPPATPAPAAPVTTVQKQFALPVTGSPTRPLVTAGVALTFVGLVALIGARARRNEAA